MKKEEADCCCCCIGGVEVGANTNSVICVGTGFSEMELDLEVLAVGVGG